jgi:predicted RNase H-like nuclease (RuvC/YqgF family)
MTKALSPNQRHKRVIQNFTDYLIKLEATGEKLPVNQVDGNVNISELARICDCKRGVFQKPENTIGRMLKKAISDIGTQAKTSNQEESALKNQKDQAQRDASKLSRELERATAEVEKLRNLITSLEQENRLLKNKLDGQTNATELMLDDGRRRFLWQE